MDSIIKNAEKYLNIANDYKDKQGDVVNACENYFATIELIEKNINKQYFDKNIHDILLQSYVYLGDMYRDLSYPYIAVENYMKSLRHVNDDSIKTHVLKRIGMTYTFINFDSAFYYFDECLKTYPNHLNEIDINKCVALILFYYYDEKDSAYAIIRKSIDMIEHENVRVLR